MATNTSPEIDNKGNWFTRTFSSRTLGSSSSTNRTNSIVNPGFVSLVDILKPKRTTEHPAKQQLSSIDESLVNIAVNAESDISSLADRSKGSIDFFHTPPVSVILNEYI
jgi:hypothetical protein